MSELQPPTDRLTYAAMLEAVDRLTAIDRSRLSRAELLLTLREVHQLSEQLAERQRQMEADLAGRVTSPSVWF